jgi:hypothetical protein
VLGIVLWSASGAAYQECGGLGLAESKWLSHQSALGLGGCLAIPNHLADCCLLVKGRNVTIEDVRPGHHLLLKDFRQNTVIGHLGSLSPRCCGRHRLRTGDLGQSDDPIRRSF